MSKESGGFLEGLWDQTLKVAGDAVDKIVTDQREMAKNNAPLKRTTFEQRRSGYERMGDESEILDEFRRSSSDGGSELGTSSTSGSSRDGSTVTRDTRESGVSALNRLTDQGRKTEGPQDGQQNGPFASPPSASVSKGSESEGDKKNQSAWEDVKNGFSKCQTCLYNAGAFAFSSVKKFFNVNVVEPISKLFKERDASEQEKFDKFFEKMQRERAASDKAFNESLRNSFSAPFVAVRGALNETLEKERTFGLYKAKHDNQGGGWSFKRREVNLGNFSNLAGRTSRVRGQAAKIGVKGVGLAGQGLGALWRAGASIGRTTFGAAQFMATPGDSSSGGTWEDRLRGAGSITQGMRSGYGPISAGRDFADWVTADNGVQTTGLPSARGVAKFLARGAASAANSGASMASKVRNMDTVVYFPGR